jgi:hypothetical protein
MPLTNASTSERSLTREQALEQLLMRSRELKRIVEGAGSVRWGYGPIRLKDTKEWVEFFNALAKVERRT